MINRRVFMCGSLAAGATVLLPAAHAMPQGWRAPLVVYGDGDPCARAFGAAMRWRGCRVLAAGADALSLIEQLEALLAQTPRPIRGLTSFSIRMIVEHATSGLGMRLAFASPYPEEPGAVTGPASTGPRSQTARKHAFGVTAGGDKRTQLYAWLLVPSAAAGASVRRSPYDVRI